MKHLYQGAYLLYPKNEDFCEKKRRYPEVSSEIIANIKRSKLDRDEIASERRIVAFFLGGIVAPLFTAVGIGLSYLILNAPFTLFSILLQIVFGFFALVCFLFSIFCFAILLLQLIVYLRQLLPNFTYHWMLRFGMTKRGSVTKIEADGDYTIIHYKFLEWEGNPNGRNPYPPHTATRQFRTKSEYAKQLKQGTGVLVLYIEGCSALL